jgi:hypothetical protein
MEIVQIAGIVFAAVVILVIAYLYRENALVEGKTEVGLGPIKFSLGGRTQKKAEAESPEAPAAPPPGVRENVVVERSQIDTVKGVEVSKNLVAQDSSITVHDSDK